AHLQLHHTVIRVTLMSSRLAAIPCQLILRLKVARQLNRPAGSQRRRSLSKGRIIIGHLTSKSGGPSPDNGRKMALEQRLLSERHLIWFIWMNRHQKIRMEIPINSWGLR